MTRRGKVFFSFFISPELIPGGTDPPACGALLRGLAGGRRALLSSVPMREQIFQRARLERGRRPGRRGFVEHVMQKNKI